jgi:hypothetical protein
VCSQWGTVCHHVELGVSRFPIYAHSGPRGPRSRLAVRVDGTTFTIEIEEGPAGQLRARIHGTPVHVDARLASCGAGSLLLDGISYLVDLGEGAAETHVVVDGEAFRVPDRQLGTAFVVRRRAVE